MREPIFALREQPQIIELLTVLEQKPSVKTSLRALKSGQAVKKSAPTTEQVR